MGTHAGPIGMHRSRHRSALLKFATAAHASEKREAHLLQKNQCGTCKGPSELRNPHMHTHLHTCARAHAHMYFAHFVICESKRCGAVTASCAVCTTQWLR